MPVWPHIIAEWKQTILWQHYRQVLEPVLECLTISFCIVTTVVFVLVSEQRAALWKLLTLQMYGNSTVQVLICDWCADVQLLGDRFQPVNPPYTQSPQNQWRERLTCFPERLSMSIENEVLFSLLFLWVNVHGHRSLALFLFIILASAHPEALTLLFCRFLLHVFGNKNDI